MTIGARHVQPERAQPLRLRMLVSALSCALSWAIGATLLAATAARAHGDHPIVPPRLLADPVLLYPEDALREGVFGDVVMDVELDAAGAVQWVQVTSAPDPRLAWAALGAVTKLPFEPARHLGEDGVEHPTAVRFSYRLSFTLGPDAVEQPVPPTVAVVGWHGRVVDATGRGIAGASVALEGTELRTQTDAQGTFNLPEGSGVAATLIVTAPGFQMHRWAVEPLGAGHEHDDLLIVLVPASPAPLADEETTVVARRGAESARSVLTQQVAVLDEEDLARVRGRTLGSTLTEVPGVITVQSGPSLEKPVVRGFFGRRLVMLVDGVRHEGQDWGIDHAPEIDPQAAGRIELVKGAAGVRYGPDAIGGVILLEPRPLRVAPGMEGELSLVGVDNGLRGTAGGRVDLVLPELPSLALRLEGNATKGASPSAPTYVLGNTASETTNVGATALWTASVAGQVASLKLSYRRFSARLGVCYCLNLRTPEELAQSTDAEAPPNAETWTTSFTIGRPSQAVVHDLVFVRGAATLGPLFRLRTTYAFQRDDRAEFDQVRQSVQGPQFSFLLFTHSLDVTLEHSPQRHGRLTWSGQGGLRGDVQEHTYRGLQLIPNHRRIVGGAWLLERLTIDDVGGLGDVELLAGARADQLLQTSFLSEAAYRTQVRRGRIGAVDCALTGEVARCAKELPAVSLTAGARMHLDWEDWSDAVVLQADVSSATRFPDVDELYLGGRAPSFPVFGLGDAGLGTERTLMVSLGAAVKLPFLELDGGAFASRVDDYIAFAPELDANGVPLVDVLVTGAYPRFSSQAVDAMVTGFDGGLVMAPHSPLSLALQGAVVRGLNLTSGGYLPFMPPPQARVELRARVPDVAGPVLLRGTRLSTSALLVGRQERTDAATDFVPPPAGYVLWGAAADTELVAADTTLRLGIEVRNLANQRYRQALSLTRFFADEVGREVWLRLELPFDIHASSASSPPAPVAVAP